MNVDIIVIALAHCRNLNKGGKCRFRPVGDDIRVNGNGGSVRFFDSGDETRSSAGGRFFWQGTVIQYRQGKTVSYRRVGGQWRGSDGSRINDTGEITYLHYADGRVVEVIRQGDELFCTCNIEKSPRQQLAGASKPKNTGAGVVWLVLIVAGVLYALFH